MYMTVQCVLCAQKLWTTCVVADVVVTDVVVADVVVADVVVADVVVADVGVADVGVFQCCCFAFVDVAEIIVHF